MNEIQVNVKSAIIEIAEREKVEQEINELAQKFKNYVPTADTLAGDRATRAELRKRLKELDDARKAVKKEYNEPLKEFENWVKQASEPLNIVIDSIDQGIKELEEHEKKLRLSTIEVAFNEKAKEAGLDPRIFTANYEKYAVAANFTAQKKLKKGILDEIDVAIQYEVSLLKKRNDDISAIATLCADYNLGSAPYIRSLDSGTELNEIIATITSDAKQHAEQAERARIEKEKRDELTQKRISEQNQTVPEQFTNQSQNVPPEPRHEPEQQGKKLKRLVLEIIIDENNPLPPFRPFLDSNGYQYKILGYEDIK